MEKVSCPFCGEGLYSASFEAGKVKCVYCEREFFIGYDEIKQLWIATDPKSPIQMMIRKAKKGNAGESK